MLNYTKIVNMQKRKILNTFCKWKRNKCTNIDIHANFVIYTLEIYTARLYYKFILQIQITNSKVYALQNLYEYTNADQKQKWLTLAPLPAVKLVTSKRGRYKNFTQFSTFRKSNFRASFK